MPTTTWATIRPELSRELGVVQAATTTNITTNNSVVSTTLANLFTSNTDLKGWYALILNDSDGSTSANTGVVKRITAYTASSGTLTVAGAALLAEDEAVDFELHRFNPAELLRLFNRARQNLSNKVFIVRDVQTAVSGPEMRSYRLPATLNGVPLQVYSRRWPTADGRVWNEITDPGFEDWASATALNSWTLAGTGASVNRESRGTGAVNHLVFEGEYSARIHTASSGVTTLRQTVTPTVTTEGSAYMYGIWAYSLSSERMSADAEGSQGSTHTGTGWEFMSLGQEINATDTTIAVGVHITAGAQLSVIVDEAMLLLGPTNPVAARPLFGPAWERELGYKYLPPADGASGNGTLEFDQPIPEHRQLRLVGKDTLSAVSADTDTIEIEEMQLEPLYYETLRLAARATSNVTVSGADDRWAQRAAEYERDRDKALRDGKRTHVAIYLPDPNGML
jgi:hypothetical protein